MDNLTDANAIVNPAPSTTCSRCQGKGRVRYTRPGGWIEENCTICRRSGVLDAETAETVRRLMEAGGAALGPAEGPCCNPTDDPCIACTPPDDVPYEPTAEDEAWYHGLCREREERLMAERIEAGPSLVEKLTALAHQFLDDADDDMVLVGEWLWEKKEQAEFFGARTATQYRDRHDAHLDAVLAEHGGPR